MRQSMVVQSSRFPSGLVRPSQAELRHEATENGLGSRPAGMYHFAQYQCCTSARTDRQRMLARLVCDQRVVLCDHHDTDWSARGRTA